MEPSQFDEFTKAMATPTSRRKALKRLAVGTIGSLLTFAGLRSALAADKKCPPGLTDCGGKCVNTRTDPNNCGVCGTKCKSGLCVNGLCCPPGAVKCGNSCCSFTCCPGNVCTNTNTDVNNCGACGNVCSPGQVCKGGKCVTVSTCSPAGNCNIGFNNCGNNQNSNCYCFTDTSGNGQCGCNAYCSNAQTCNTNADCPSGYFCAINNGCTGCGGPPGVCLQNCTQTCALSLHGDGPTAAPRRQ